MPVTREGREIALSIGKINGRGAHEINNGERVFEKKKKKNRRYFPWKDGRKEGNFLFIPSVITGISLVQLKGKEEFRSSA